MIGELVAEYEQAGYDVELVPPQHRLPVFLEGFYPDFVATRGSEKVVVDIRSAVKVRPVNYWREAANAVRQHQTEGWKFKYSVDLQPSETFDGISLEDIVAQLGEAEKLESEGRFSSSLLITWAALELVMRWAVDANRVKVPDYTPARLISNLYSDGVLDRGEYDLLVKYLTISHDRPWEILGQIVVDDLKKLRALARRLLLPASDAT